MHDELEQRIAKCFATILPELGPDELREAKQDVTLGWDSLCTMTLISLMEEEFDCWFGFDRAEEMKTFAAVVKVVRDKVR